jgi:type IV pilus assembly protein PilA
MFKKLGKNQKGFTLLEILIVIAVLGILTAVAIPLISGVMSNAKVASANIEVSTVKVAAQGYLAGHSNSTSVNSDALFDDGVISVKPTVVYTIDLNTFKITSVLPATYPGTTAIFDITSQLWVKP